MADLHKTFHINELGCAPRNQDALKLKNYFLMNGYKFMYSYEQSYYKIFVTCGLNGERINEFLELIDKNSNNGIVIITGCLPATFPNGLLKHRNAIILLIKDLENIDDYIDDIKIKFSDINDCPLIRDYLDGGREEYNKISDLFIGFGFNYHFTKKFLRRITLILKSIYINKNALQKVTIKISQGCMSHCTYCGIKFGIGKLKSKTINQITEEYEEVVKKGVRNILLVADDTGAYGIDIGTTFPQLLYALKSKNGNKKIFWHIHDISPNFVKSYINDLCYFIKQRCFYEILVSIQSGSDRILNLMKRKYKSDEIIPLLILMKKANPYLRIRASFIIGFPSENEEDFQKSISFCKTFRFDFVYIIPYYENNVCESQKILPKIPSDVIKNRLSFFSTFLKGQKTDHKITDY